MQPDDIWERILNDVTYKGRHFGWPWGPDTRTLFLNHDILIEVGLDPEEPIGDWEAFHNASSKIHTLEGENIYPPGLCAKLGQRRYHCRLDDSLLAARHGSHQR